MLKKPPFPPANGLASVRTLQFLAMDHPFALRRHGALKQINYEPTKTW